MFSILGATIFIGIALLYFLAVLGFPLGEYLMGGQHKILPKKNKMMVGSSIPIQIFAVIIILQGGGYLPFWLSPQITKNICIFFAVYLTINTAMNFFSRSKKEKMLMTPLSTLAAISYWYVGLSLIV